MILFKYQSLQTEFDGLNERVRHIVFALSAFCEYEFDKPLIITSVYRDQDGSTHKYWRALDFRVEPKGGEAVYSDEEIQLIKDFCGHYVYDKTRQDLNTLRVHDAGSGLHGHIQVNGTGKTEMVSGD